MSTLVYPQTNEVAQSDLNQKVRCMKRIKLQVQKKLFEAKKIGDTKECILLMDLIARLDQKKIN